MRIVNFFELTYFISPTWMRSLKDEVREVSHEIYENVVSLLGM